MAEINNGGAAFPMIGNVGHNSDWLIDYGMSLRAYYAGQALPAVIEKCLPFECQPGETMEQMFARKAVSCADALIAALNPTP